MPVFVSLIIRQATQEGMKSTSINSKVRTICYRVCSIKSVWGRAVLFCTQKDNCGCQLLLWVLISNCPTCFVFFGEETLLYTFFQTSKMYSKFKISERPKYFNKLLIIGLCLRMATFCVFNCCNGIINIWPILFMIP